MVTSMNRSSGTRSGFSRPRRAGARRTRGLARRAATSPRPGRPRGFPPAPSTFTTTSRYPTRECKAPQVRLDAGAARWRRAELPLAPGSPRRPSAPRRSAGAGRATARCRKGRDSSARPPWAAPELDERSFIVSVLVESDAVAKVARRDFGAGVVAGERRSRGAEQRRDGERDDDSACTASKDHCLQGLSSSIRRPGEAFAGATGRGEDRSTAGGGAGAGTIGAGGGGSRRCAPRASRPRSRRG